MVFGCSSTTTPAICTGRQTVSFTITAVNGNPTVAVSADVITTQAPAALWTAPAPGWIAAGGQALASQPVVQIRDASNLTVTAASGILVTAAIASASPTGGTLSGRTVLGSGRGTAAFTDLQIDRAAVYVLVFSASGLTPVNLTLTVVAGPPAALNLALGAVVDGGFSLTAAVVDAGGALSPPPTSFAACRFASRSLPVGSV
jgi:hypothetical protein